MLRSEVLGELDKCFELYESDVNTRWCKLLVLLEHLYNQDRNEKDYIARVDLSRFLLNIISFDTSVVLEEHLDITTCEEAVDYLGVCRYEIGIPENIILLYFADVNDRNVHLKLAELDVVGVKRCMLMCMGEI